MDTDVLAQRWRDATNDLKPAPGFTATVVRGGRGRAVRSRLRIMAAVTVAVVAAAAGVLNAGLVGPTDLGDERLTQPTRGDLAGDGQLLADAVRAWRAGIAVSYNASRGIFDDLRGQPHVYWAGRTPAGRAAVVMQRSFLHPHGDLSPADANHFQTLVGLVAVNPRDGQLRLVTDQYRAHGFPPSGYFRFGPHDRTVLVVDGGIPLYFSSVPHHRPDGKVTRDWQPLPVVDGVALTQVPDDADPADALVLARLAPPAADDRSFDGLLFLEPASEYLDASDRLRRGDSGESPVQAAKAADHRLPWHGEDANAMRVGGSVPPGGNAAEMFANAIDEAGALDIGTTQVGFGLWQVVAGLPDGRTVVVSEVQEGQRPSRVYAVLIGTDKNVLRGDVIDLNAALPVALRLPDAQGWVVAAYSSHLRYRISAQTPWVDVGSNAALLPDQAAQVEVTGPSGLPAVTVDLAR
jgi:hypothetical protein